MLLILFIYIPSQIPNLLHVIVKSAFIAKTSSGGMMTDGPQATAVTSKLSLSSTVRTFTLSLIWSADEPILMTSLISPIAVLLRLRVLFEAELESTLGVVTFTSDTG